MDVQSRAGPFDDQDSLLNLMVKAAQSAARRAARENDKRALLTPVLAHDGRMHFILNWQAAVEESVPMEAPACTVGDCPWVWMVAGPDGAGKSTFINEFLRDINATDLVPLSVEGRAVELKEKYRETLITDYRNFAASEVELEMLKCIRAGQSCLVESIASTPQYGYAINESKERGYKFGFVYFSLALPQLSEARACLCEKKGGANIDPDPDHVKTRWVKSHEHASLYASQADTFVAFDNSAEDRVPVLVAAKLAGRELVCMKPDVSGPLRGILKSLRKGAISLSQE